MWLTSKLAYPFSPTRAVARPRLNELLDRWPDYRLVLVRAAAGYGKTTLVSTWAAGTTPGSVAWLSLDPGESDAIQFMRYIAAAIDRVVPGAVDLVEPILRDLEPDARMAMATLLAALEPNGPLGAATDDRHFLLILDDYHRVRSAEVDALVDLALQRAPESLHFMILTRDLPSLALPRLMVNGGLLELSAADLRFDHEELTDFLKTLGLAVHGQTPIDEILSQSEGWVAGLKVAALSLAGRKDAAAYLEHLHGANHWQVEYLSGEVLSHQPPELHDFLLQTSILNQLNSRLCTAVTGQADAPALLSRAYAAGLFLIPLDNRRDWFRYHHLFQESLQLRLSEVSSETAVRALHQRAATWLEAEGNGAEAFDHYLAAGETDAAAALLGRLVDRALETNDLHEAEVLVGRLPTEVVDRQPGLLLSLAWINLLRNDMQLLSNTARAERALGLIEPNDPARPGMEARLAVFKMAGAILQRRLNELETLMRHAGEQESLLNDQYRVMLWYLQLHHAMHRSEWDKAELLGNRAIAAYQLSNDILGLISTRREMAVRLLFTGRAAKAARELDEVIADYPPPQPNLVLRDMQYTLLQAGEVYYWLNDMERLRLRARAAAEMAHQLGVELAYTMAGQLLDLYNLSNPNQPDTEFHQPRSIVQGEGGFFPFNSLFEIIYQVRLGNMGNAQIIAEGLGFVVHADPSTISQMRLPTFALVHVAAGRDLEAIDGMMAYGLATLGRTKNLYLLGRLQAIEAWRQLRLGNRRAATKALAAAVETANETGMVRAILDIPELAPLLMSVRHPRAIALVERMVINTEAPSPGSAELTPTELRVLKMLAQDFRYTDVAAALSISINTVQTHTASIYRKLGVSRRMAAIEVARQGGLIE